MMSRGDRAVTPRTRLAYLAVRVAGFYDQALLPPAEKFIDDTDTKVTDRVKTILAGFANGNLDSTLFTSKLGAVLNKEAAAGLGKDIHNLGPLQSIGLLERKQEGRNTTFRYRVHFSNVPLFIQLSIDQEDKIAKLSIYD